jgi:polysaccharide biosynthesis protein PslF
MRIGIVSGEYPPDVGGVGDQAARLAQELVARGHAVQVVTTAPAGASPAPAPPGDSNPLVLRVIARWDWRLLREVPRLAGEGGWDVLHIQYQPGAFQLRGAIHLLPSWIGRRRPAPAVVTTFHDLRVPYLFPKAGPLRRAAVRHLARSGQGVIAAEGDDLHRLREWTAGQRRPPEVRQVPLGNALDVPPPEGFERGAWRDRLGLAPGASLIGHFGFVNRTKGVDTLVQALARLTAGGRDVHLLMIGDSLGASDPTNREYLEEVRRQVAGAGLDGRVHWTGFCDPPQVAGWLRCLDVCALPFAEGASLRRTSIQAAWAHGAPLVTTTGPGQASWPAGGAAAATVPPGDPEALAATLGDLLDCPPRRQELARAGRQQARRTSWERVAGETLDLYRAALALIRSAQRPQGDQSDQGASARAAD